MAKIENTLESIGALMELMNNLCMEELELKEGDFSLRLKSAVRQAVMPQGAGVVDASLLAPSAPFASPCANLPQKGNVICSPIVGTFYAAPAQDKPPFTSVGSPVKTGDVVFIIESMKLMNEIQSDFDGMVTEILVENGQPVEFGQPIMRIE